MIRLMIVDDQEMIRAGIRSVLSSFDDIDVVGEAMDGLDAVRQLAEPVADVVLMDIRMPGIDGVEATKSIRERHSSENLRIVVLTTFEQDENVVAALKAGANGFLNKGVGPRELVAGIREVVAGGGALSSAAAAVLIDRLTTEKTPVIDRELAARFDDLTPRDPPLHRDQGLGKRTRSRRRRHDRPDRGAPRGPRRQWHRNPRQQAP